MTKAEIVNEISYQTGIERSTVSKTVDTLMKTIKDSMTNGDNLYLRGFGSFLIKKKAEKNARNISKNSTIIIPAHNAPSFKPSKEFLVKVKL